MVFKKATAFSQRQIVKGRLIQSIGGTHAFLLATPDLDIHRSSKHGQLSGPNRTWCRSAQTECERVNIYTCGWRHEFRRTGRVHDTDRTTASALPEPEPCVASKFRKQILKEQKMKTLCCRLLTIIVVFCALHRAWAAWTGAVSMGTTVVLSEPTCASPSSGLAVCAARGVGQTLIV